MKKKRPRTWKDIEEKSIYGIQYLVGVLSTRGLLLLTSNPSE